MCTTSFEHPKYDVDECVSGHELCGTVEVKLRSSSSSGPGNAGQVGQDIKEQDVYMGDMPLMTSTARLSSTAPSAYR